MTDVTHAIAAGPEPESVTVGASGLRKYWSKDALKHAAEKLAEGGCPIRVSNERGWDIVGKVVNAEYDDEHGLVYSMEIHDDEIVEKLDNSLAVPTISACHPTVEDLTIEKHGDKSAIVLDEAEVRYVYMAPNVHMSGQVIGLLDLYRDQPLSKYLE